jgi:hypothetical protein
MFKLHVLMLTSGPISVNGYYPLFETEKEAREASPDKTFHTHVFDKKYYMPNGVTHYHGNYVITKH